MIIWDRIYNWFSDIRERNSFLRDWNRAAKEAYINGDVPTLLEARTTIGTIEWRHEFSKFMAGGFRVKALSGKAMSKPELIDIGNIIINNNMLVRKLVSNGWDTLEVHDSSGNLGCKWQLKKHTIRIGEA
jgi:hypothetical protein